MRVKHKEIFNNIDKYTQDVKDGVIREVAETAVSIEGGAITRAPVDTGNLKNSFVVRYHTGGLGAVISNTAEYFPYVELGTYKMPAQPSLFPSYEEQIGTFNRNMAQILKKAP